MSRRGGLGRRQVAAPGQAGIAAARSFFEAEQVVQRYERVYEQLARR